MRLIEGSVKKQVEQILEDLDIPTLYRSYEWIGDSWERGFPDLIRLEQEVSNAARQNNLRKAHLLKIAEWGKLPNTKQITCPDPIKLTLYENNIPVGWLKTEPEIAISILKGQIRGFGPTYASKLLHFAVPQVFGAIDTRLVRTFGSGDLDSQRYPLLNLTTEISGERWAISSFQKGWPGEYGTWISIINYIANRLNKNERWCPHPEKYIHYGLREKGIWLPADVETALFAYASQEIVGIKK
jgi:hypothetical protein